MASDSTAPNQAPATPARPFQFSLQQMLIAVAASALVLTPLAQFGFDGFVLSLGMASAISLAYGAYYRKALLVLGFPGVGFFIFCCLFPPLGPHRESARRLQCSSNLKQIAYALMAYEAAKGTLPPAYIADANGKPMHSWRVLILPYLEQKALYDRYNFNEPWDGPNNRLLAAEMPNIFRCPSQPRPASGPQTETNYVAVVGPRTAWPEGTPSSVVSPPDGSASTLLVVEVHDSGISWMEPRDLHIGQMPLAINPPRGQGISSRHGAPRDQGRGNVANCAFCDGHVQALPNDLPPHLLRAQLTANGGEDVSRDEHVTSGRK